MSFTIESKGALVAPSILSADLLHLGEALEATSGADLIHFDVMDGHFVPNLSFGPPLLSEVRRGTTLPIDCHLMVTNPDEVFTQCLDAGADIVSFHFEAARHPLRICSEIRARGAKAAVAINPGTAISALDALICAVDMVLVMSVNPGFGGQRFIEGTYHQLEELAALCERRGAHPLVEVDGGISAANAEAVCAAGADALVAGSAVYKAGDPGAVVAAIREAGTLGIERRRAKGQA